MNNIFRGLIAGYGAKKLGGGCFSTIIVFIIIWYVLGKCGNDNTTTRQTVPTNGSIMKKHDFNTPAAPAAYNTRNYYL